MDSFEEIIKEAKLEHTTNAGFTDNVMEKVIATVITDSDNGESVINLDERRAARRLYLLVSTAAVIALLGVGAVLFSGDNSKSSSRQVIATTTTPESTTTTTPNTIDTERQKTIDEIDAIIVEMPNELDASIKSNSLNAISFDDSDI